MKLLLCAIPAAAALALAPLPLQAQHLSPLPPTLPTIAATSSYVTFGMAGIAEGETARVNALNLAAGGPIVAGGSCQVTVTFLDESGKTLATQTLPAGQGQAVHFDLPRSGAESGADPVEIRATVSAVFSVSATANTSSPAFCSIVPTMEIFDQSTGRTSVHLETTHTLSAVVPLTVLPD
jgi:hypothetical protein